LRHIEFQDNARRHRTLFPNGLISTRSDSLIEEVLEARVAFEHIGDDVEHPDLASGPPLQTQPIGNSLRQLKLGASHQFEKAWIIRIISDPSSEPIKNSSAAKL
jgi:hypothetical protein